MPFTVWSVKNVSLCCHVINWIFFLLIMAIFDLAYLCFLLSAIKNVSLCGHIITVLGLYVWVSPRSLRFSNRIHCISLLINGLCFVLFLCLLCCSFSASLIWYISPFPLPAPGWQFYRGTSYLCLVLSCLTLGLPSLSCPPLFPTHAFGLFIQPPVKRVSIFYANGFYPVGSSGLRDFCLLGYY